jgi:hypothetical protein
MSLDPIQQLIGLMIHAVAWRPQCISPVKTRRVVRSNTSWQSQAVGRHFGRRPVAFVRLSAPRGRGRAQTLLNLRFLELDMLAHDGIILAHHHLFGSVRAARVFLGGVVKAGVSSADELDLDRDRLCHDVNFRI